MSNPTLEGAIGGGSAAPVPFRCFEKGNLAVIGKNYAVLKRLKFQLSGLLARLTCDDPFIVHGANQSQDKRSCAVNVDPRNRPARIALDCLSAVRMIKNAVPEEAVSQG